MKLNTAPVAKHTHEGGVASHLSPIQELKRTVLACMLWEKGFYEEGVDVATRMRSLIAKCKPDDVKALALLARNQMYLRHVPLFLLRELSRIKGTLISQTLFEVIQRPDELAEFLAMYWQDGKTPISKQVKKGLALAFTKFNEYSLAKYNRDSRIKLRDVLFMVHAKPKDKEQEELWKKLVNNTLETPDTWEVQLSAGKDKQETFTRLLKERKLGYLALLRNLRNMVDAKVDTSLISDALLSNVKGSKVLPFRFIAAARACPSMERVLDQAMQMAVKDLPKLPGKTAVLVDVSGSMSFMLSGKSDLNRLDAAKALAILVNSVAEECRVWKFNYNAAEVAPRQGMALGDAIGGVGGGTHIGAAVKTVNAAYNYDRIIVITDEQSQDAVGAPTARGYMLNVANYQNGVGYGQWTHIHGFSEACVNFIQEYENAK